MVDAKTRQIETENHLRAMSERESARVRSDIKKQEQDLKDLQDRVSTLCITELDFRALSAKAASSFL